MEPTDLNNPAPLKVPSYGFYARQTGKVLSAEEKRRAVSEILRRQAAAILLQVSGFLFWDSGFGFRFSENPMLNVQGATSFTSLQPPSYPPLPSSSSVSLLRVGQKEPWFASRISYTRPNTTAPWPVIARGFALLGTQLCTLGLDV